MKSLAFFSANMILGLQLVLILISSIQATNSNDEEIISAGKSMPLSRNEVEIEQYFSYASETLVPQLVETWSITAESLNLGDCALDTRDAQWYAYFGKIDKGALTRGAKNKKFVHAYRRQKQEEYLPCGRYGVNSELITLKSNDETVLYNVGLIQKTETKKNDNSVTHVVHFRFSSDVDKDFKFKVFRRVINSKAGLVAYKMDYGLGVVYVLASEPQNENEPASLLDGQESSELPYVFLDRLPLRTLLKPQKNVADIELLDIITLKGVTPLKMNGVYEFYISETGPHEISLLNARQPEMARFLDDYRSYQISETFNAIPEKHSIGIYYKGFPNRVISISPEGIAFKQGILEHPVCIFFTHYDECTVKINFGKKAVDSIEIVYQRQPRRSSPFWLNK